MAICSCSNAALFSISYLPSSIWLNQFRGRKITKLSDKQLFMLIRNLCCKPHTRTEHIATTVRICKQSREEKSHTTMIRRFLYGRSSSESYQNLDRIDFCFDFCLGYIPSLLENVLNINKNQKQFFKAFSISSSKVRSFFPIRWWALSSVVRKQKRFGFQKAGKTLNTYHNELYFNYTEIIALGETMKKTNTYLI